MLTPTPLVPPVDPARDHALGPPGAEITLVEYGSYACPHCRAANERIAEVRDQLGDRLRYVFRHRPLTGSDIARRAAELIERALAPLGLDRGIARRTRMFVTDISRWEEYGRAHGEVPWNVSPATTMVEVSHLIDPDMLVEIEAEALFE